jgi:hypothetical protein
MIDGTTLIHKCIYSASPFCGGNVLFQDQLQDIEERYSFYTCSIVLLMSLM